MKTYKYINEDHSRLVEMEEGKPNRTIPTKRIYVEGLEGVNIAPYEAPTIDHIARAEALYKTLKAKRVIDGYDLSDTFEFDFQRKKGGNVRMKKAGGKTETKTKAQTDAIEGKLYAYLNSCSDALDADIDAIETGDFTLSNLNAL